MPLCCSVGKPNELNILSLWKEDWKLRYFNQFTLSNCRVLNFSKRFLQQFSMKLKNVLCIEK